MRRAQRWPLLACALLCACEAAREPAPPDLVLVSLDTTRADRLGSYGHPGGLTPELDRFAAGATRYERAYSPSSWTLPAHASLFTGKLPSSHGAKLDPKGPISLATALADGRDWSRYRARGLAESEETLAERLQARGYACAGIVAGPWMKRSFGLAQGFGHYDDSGIEELNGRRAGEVTDAALAWLRARPAGPVFLFLNYYDPHFPFSPPPAFMPAPPDTPPADAAARDAWLRALYDAELRYVDAEFGRLLRGLRELGRYDAALIAVTADHGELLGEHGGFGHGKSLYEAEIRVPLLIRAPGQPPDAGAVVRDPVSLIDVFPTLLRELGLPAAAEIQGELLPAPAHPIVAEVDPLPSASGEGPWRALVAGDWKLARSERGGTRLFDLAADPREQRDRAADERARAEELEQRLGAYLASLPQPAEAGPAQELDAQTQRALEALGYLEE